MKTKLSLSQLSTLILSTLLALALAAGCAAPAPEVGGGNGGVITGEPVVDAADAAVRGAFDTLNTLAKWQYDNREKLRKNPAGVQSLKAAKSNVWKAIDNSARRRDAYAKDRLNPEAKTRLEAALAEMGKAVATAGEVTVRSQESGVRGQESGE